MERQEGFADQRLCVVPRPAIAAALGDTVSRRLVVTDAGWFPHAVEHGLARPDGAAEAIAIFCTDGEGWVEVEGRRSRLTRSTAVLIPPGAAHAYGASDADPWTIWWVHLRGDDVADFCHAIGPEPLTTISAPERVIGFFDEIVSVLERDHSPPSLVLVAGIAWRLLAQLAVDRVRPGRDEPVTRALQYLRDHVGDTVRVADVAKLVGVSPSQLGLLFRRATGHGVLAYHIGLKMTRARYLLDTTGDNVSEISRSLGYRDAYYFSRQFAHVHGVSPTAYRRTRKG